jgi:hypothetical protein
LHVKAFVDKKALVVTPIMRPIYKEGTAGGYPYRQGLGVSKHYILCYGP